MTREQIYNITIDELDFSNRVYEILKENSIFTVGDLSDKTACELGLSSKSSYVGAKEFAIKLGKKGIRLIDNVPKLDQVLAVMLGHAIADALGVPVEFMSRSKLSADPVTGYIGYGTHNVPAGTWSDDTSMALATLDSLSYGLDYSDIMRRFCDWKNNAAYTATDEVFDMGITTNDSLCKFLKGRDPLDCGGRDEHDNGNGALMRIIPAILYCDCLYSDTTVEERLGIIHDICSLTHAHPRSKVGCGIYAFVLSKLLSIPQKASIRSALVDANAFYKKIPEFAAEFACYSRLLDKDFAKVPAHEIKSSGYVVDTLEAAIWCLLNTESYDECVLKAVNLGKDTDTVAAIAGGLAGALYGMKGIPHEWVEGLRRNKMIFDLSKKFVDSFESASHLIYDEARASINASRENKYLLRQRNRQVNDFACRMLSKFSDEDTRESDVSSFEIFGAICFAFGFTTDLDSLGNEYRNTFSKDKLALNDFCAFERVAFKVRNVDMLGSVIFAKWRHITHWTSDSLLSPKNRSWFISAFKRLAEITSDPIVEREPFFYVLDAHGHYVFGVDDGATTLDMSVDMVRCAFQQGVRALICTSHSWGYCDMYEKRFAQLREQIKKEKIDVKMYEGTEVACTYRTMPIIIEQLNAGKLRPLASSKYVLLEFDPRISGDELKLCMKYMYSSKFRPVIAHIERYKNLYNDEHTLDVLQHYNIPIQINAYSLVEEKKDDVRNFARKLVAEKRVTFIGSDAHQMKHRAPNVKTGIEYIYAHCDTDYANDICFRNAERLLLGVDQ